MAVNALIRGNAGGYVFAILATLVAWAVRYALDGWFPPGFPYLTFFPAVVITAYFAGLRPSILCAVLSGVAAWYFFIPPFHSLSINSSTALALAFYAFVVAVDVFFIDGMRKALRQLEEERARYAALAESRDLLYRELHHRVSNNLQVVGALLRLQGSGINDEDARHALAEAGGRIELIAKIQRELHNAVGDPGDQPLHPDQATPVTLVMLESFNNALEHGFGEGGSGRVQASLDQSGLTHVLTVRDDGAGPPDGFDPTASKSLGLRIVRAMAQQLGGKFEMSREDGWTVCRLSYAPKRD
ncbi:MAG: histidine kinase [Caulobacter vibrioides]|uniref:histidine kinase n=1 Tax=Caulobacter vibrioides TaxID=155892 RepID=A0A258D811_CAUVI|nr:MAG: histidine kinase [Caulobacter vibrioides]